MSKSATLSFLYTVPSFQLPNDKRCPSRSLNGHYCERNERIKMLILLQYPFFYKELRLDILRKLNENQHLRIQYDLLNKITSIKISLTFNNLDYPSGRPFDFDFAFTTVKAKAKIFMKISQLIFNLLSNSPDVIYAFFLFSCKTSVCTI